jgi:hypothetical protein
MLKTFLLALLVLYSGFLVSADDDPNSHLRLRSHSGTSGAEGRGAFSTVGSRVLMTKEGKKKSKKGGKGADKGTPAPTPAPTRNPTPAPTTAPTPSPTPAPTCAPGPGPLEPCSDENPCGFCLACCLIDPITLLPFCTDGCPV